MRLHLGASMPIKGGRPAVAGVEILEGRDQQGRSRHLYRVGLMERITPYGVDTTRDACLAFLTAVRDQRPCVIVDTGSPAGLALYQTLKTTVPRELHKPHSYPGTGPRPLLFAEFLRAYSDGRVEFEPGLRHRNDLDRALVFYQGGGVQKHGVELESEDEALVVALGLAMTWPRHGPRAEPIPDTEVKPAEASRRR